MDGRDRDSAGRPRNARPRDALGRPLPRGTRGVDRVAEDVTLSPDEALRQAQRFLDEGYPFHAHEVFEGVWKATTGEYRELWQGLAQLAVGLTHLQRGNPKGAVALLRRAADRIAPYSADPPHGLNVASLASQARSLATLIHCRMERPGEPFGGLRGLGTVKWNLLAVRGDELDACWDAVKLQRGVRGDDRGAGRV